MAARTKRIPEASDAFSRCQKWLEQDSVAHDAFVAKVEKRYKAYRAVIDIRSDAAAWTSKQHPPYVLQVVETMVANLLDPTFRWRIKARPKLTDAAAWEQISLGAKSLELLLAEQVDADRLPEKQGVFAKQALIAGLSVYKTFWDYREQRTKRQEVIQEPLYDDYGGVIAMLPSTRVADRVEVVRDDPTAEVVDVRDFIWHEAAVSLDKAKRVHHRVWMSFEELKRLERAGIYENVDRLRDVRSMGDQYSEREQDLFQTSRTKDMISVVETWYQDEDGSMKVCSAGNGAVALRERDHPFGHGEYPFVVCSAMPDMFRIPGVSTVEIVADLQEMLWTLINQRLDNVRLLNNAIVLLRSDLYDLDAFEWYPGAQWAVDDPAQVKLLEITPIPAQISLEAEALLKGDIQNVTGGMPFMSGTESQSIDQQTATGVSIVTSLAQRRLAAHKQQFKWAYKRVGEQWISLNQQFMTDPRLVEIVGPGGVNALRKILPEEIIASGYYIDVEQMDESLMRQERRAEAQAKLQVALNAVPVVAALAAQGMAQMINVDAFLEDFLEAFDISDKARYFVAQKPQAQALPPGPGGGQTPALPSGNGAGQTAPQATDVNSPSNAFSQSPVAALQRMAAMAGGPANSG